MKDEGGYGDQDKRVKISCPSHEQRKREWISTNTKVQLQKIGLPRTEI